MMPIGRISYESGQTFFKATTIGTETTGTCKWTLDSDGLLLIEPTNNDVFYIC